MDGLQILVLMLALVVLILLFQVRDLSQRIRRLERGFEFGSGVSRPSQFVTPAAPSASPVSAAGPASPAVLAYIGAGKKIEAIRQYRIETGVGLKEAKDAVEAIERGGR